MRSTWSVRYAPATRLVVLALLVALAAPSHPETVDAQETRPATKIADDPESREYPALLRAEIISLLANQKDAEALDMIERYVRFCRRPADGEALFDALYNTIADRRSGGGLLFATVDGKYGKTEHWTRLHRLLVPVFQYAELSAGEVDPRPFQLAVRRQISKHLDWRFPAIPTHLPPGTRSLEVPFPSSWNDVEYEVWRIPALPREHDDRAPGKPLDVFDVDTEPERVPREKWERCPVKRSLEPALRRSPHGKNGWPSATFLKLDVDLAKPGLYLFRTTIEGLRNDEFIQVASTILTIERKSGTWEIRALNPWTGTPIPELQLTARDHEQQHSDPPAQPVTRWSGVTNTQGIWRLAVNREIEVACLRDGEWIYQGAGFHGSDPENRPTPNDTEVDRFVYLSTDRSLYRPGQTIHFKAIGRERRAGALVVPAPTPVTIHLRDESGRSIRSTTVTWNEFGTAAGEFPLPTDCRLGSYRLHAVVRRPDDALPRSIDVFEGATSYTDLDWTIPLKVEEYRKPEFEVRITALPATPKGRERVRVAAHYFIGGPVPDAEVEWSVVAQWPGYSSPKHPSVWPGRDRGEPFLFADTPRFDPRGWYYRGQPGLYDNNDDESDSFHRYFGWQTESVVARGTARTAADGTIEVEFDRMSQHDDLGKLTPESLLSYQVRAVVTDRSSLSASGQAPLPAGAAQRHIEIGLDRLFYEPGQAIDVQLRLVQGAQPLADQEIELVGLWSDHGFGKGPEFETYQSFRIRTGVDGMARQRVTAPRAGLLRWRARLIAEGPRPVETRHDVWIAGDAATRLDPRFDRKARAEFWLERLSRLTPNEKEWRGRSDYDFLFRDAPQLIAGVAEVFDHARGLVDLLPDRVAYTRREKLRFLVRAETVPVRARLSLLGKQFARDMDLELKKPCEVIELDLPAEAPNLLLARLVAMRDGWFADSSAYLFVYPEEKFLQVSVRSDRADYGPRETARVDVEVRDAAGQPVTADVELAVIDEAILALAPDRLADPRLHFNPARDPSFELSVGVWMPLEYNVSYRDVPDLPSHGQTPMPDEPRNSQFTLQRQLFGYGGMGGMGGGMGGGTFGGAPSSAISDAGSGALGNAESAQFTRSQFADTWHWTAQLRTGNDGRGSVSIPAPDNLTRWRILARAVDRETRVGQATSSTVTRKPLLVRLITPRFFHPGDQGTVSTIVRNDLPQAAEVDVQLVIGDDKVLGKRRVKVAADTQQKVDWPVVIGDVRSVVFRAEATAVGAKARDSVQVELPVRTLENVVHTAVAGRAAPEWTGALELPRDRRPGSAQLELYLAPSHAAAMREALPYLAGYPYGCVEQTMSRFLPAVAASRALKRAKLDDRELAKELPAMVDRGLQRLYAFQHEDGGWGWWQRDNSDSFMTTYVLFGLLTARDAAIDVDAETVTRALEYLRENEQNVFALYVRGLAGNDIGEPLQQWKAPVEPGGRRVSAFVLSRTEQLALAVLAGRREFVREFALVTPERRTSQTVRDVAFEIRARYAVDPKDPRIDALVDWLLANRRGRAWESTLDSAYAVLALADLPLNSGAVKPTVVLNGRELAATGDRLVVRDGDLRDGANELKVRAPADARTYVSAELRYESRRVPTAAPGARAPSGAAPRLDRWFERFDPQHAAADDYAHDGWVRLKPGDAVRAGERLRVCGKLTGLEHWQQVLLEIPIPAGVEFPWDDNDDHDVYGYSHVERHDNRVEFALAEIASGEEFAYELRATLPGKYQMRPASAHTMYEASQSVFSEPLELIVKPAE